MGFQKVENNSEDTSKQRTLKHVFKTKSPA